MRYDVVLAPEAIEDLKDLKASVRAEVRDAIVKHLRHQPTRTGKSRIKRLRGFSRPQYRHRDECLPLAVACLGPAAALNVVVSALGSSLGASYGIMSERG